MLYLKKFNLRQFFVLNILNMFRQFFAVYYLFNHVWRPLLSTKLPVCFKSLFQWWILNIWVGGRVFCEHNCKLGTFYIIRSAKSKSMGTVHTISNTSLMIQFRWYRQIRDLLRLFTWSLIPPLTLPHSIKTRKDLGNSSCLRRREHFVRGLVFSDVCGGRGDSSPYVCLSSVSH